MKIILREFLPREAQDTEWEEFFEKIDPLLREIRPDESLHNRKQRKQNMLKEGEIYKIQRFYVKDKKSDEIYGYATYETVKEKSSLYDIEKDTVVIEMGIFKEYRGKGLAKEIIKALTELADENGKKLIKTYTKMEAGIEINHLLGGEITYLTNEIRVNIKQIHEILEKWKNIQTGHTLESFSKLPENLISEFLRIFNTAMNYSLPDEEHKITITPENRKNREKVLKDQNISWITSIAKSNDKIIGFIDVFHNNSMPNLLFLNNIWVEPEQVGENVEKEIFVKLIRNLQEQNITFTDMVARENIDNPFIENFFNDLKFEKVSPISSFNYSTKELLSVLK
jgi:GNAT superfamily N-acetyltransferase